MSCAPGSGSACRRNKLRSPWRRAVVGVVLDGAGRACVRARLGGRMGFGRRGQVGHAGVAVHGKVDGEKGLLVIFCGISACATVVCMPRSTRTLSNVCVVFWW